MLNFFKKKRSIYFSLVIMLTLVTGLLSISFSYFIDETGNTGLIKINELDNQIFSESLNNGNISVKPNEKTSFKIYVISNNNFDTKYELYYQSLDKDNIKVKTLEEVKTVIASHEIHEYNITIENIKNEEVNVNIGIASNYLDKEIVSPGDKIA